MADKLELTGIELEVYQLRKEYQDWLDDVVNFEDTSVGVYWLGELDEKKLEDVKDMLENVKVLYWDASTLVIRDSNRFIVTFKLVTISEDSNWAIVSIEGVLKQRW